MIDLVKIETFLRAAEMLNFSDTAKQLHMSQPAVSGQIKNLEEELNVILFTRTNTGIRLTEAGRSLLPWAHRLVGDIKNMQLMMASIQTDIVGELRLACSTTAGKYVLPQMAARFCRRIPGVKVKILACTPEDVALKLLDGDAHIGVISREIQDAGVDSQEFFKDTISLIVPSDHRWVKRKSIEPSELLEEAIILREETSGTRRVLLSELSKFDIGIDDLNIFMELGNAEAIVRTVAAGYGVAFVSKLASAYPLDKGNITEVNVVGLNLKRTIYMVRKNIRDPHRPSEAFWTFIHAPENADLILLPGKNTPV